MTNEALDVLAEVRRLGGDVKLVAPGRLRVVAPALLLADLAERVRIVKPRILAVLANADNVAASSNAPKPQGIAVEEDVDEWRMRHHEALAYWGAFHPGDEAAVIAWGEMQCLWRKRHGESLPEGMCAGCGQPLGNGPMLPLDQDSVVHIAMLDCVIAYGERWRGAATRALKSMGLVPPTEDK